MSEHVLEWLGAYYDGELHGDQRRRVEAHLSACADCRAELEVLQGLSARLQVSPPMPARTPSEQFVSQVRLRLAPRKAPTPGRARLRQAAGVWLPLGVLGLWAFGQAVLLVSGVALALVALPVVLPPLPALGALPLLAALAAPVRGDGLLALFVLEVTLTVVTAGLAWGCLAGWWAARKGSVTTQLTSGERAG